jgi:hypothetical protein
MRWLYAIAFLLLLAGGAGVGRFNPTSPSHLVKTRF